jgi:hypothetical protein
MGLKEEKIQNRGEAFLNILTAAYKNFAAYKKNLIIGTPKQEFTFITATGGSGAGKVSCLYIITNSKTTIASLIASKLINTATLSTCVLDKNSTSDTMEIKYPDIFKYTKEIYVDFTNGNSFVEPEEKVAIEQYMVPDSLLPHYGKANL